MEKYSVIDKSEVDEESQIHGMVLFRLAQFSIVAVCLFSLGNAGDQ